jgi:hypothetical protein
LGLLLESPRASFPLHCIGQTNTGPV